MCCRKQYALQVRRSDLLALFNFEGISLRCTLKTEQRRKKSKATEGVASKDATTNNSIVELLIRNRSKDRFRKMGKYNFVKNFC